MSFLPAFCMALLLGTREYYVFKRQHRRYTLDCNWQSHFREFSFHKPFATTINLNFLPLLHCICCLAKYKWFVISETQISFWFFATDQPCVAWIQQNKCGCKFSADTAKFWQLPRLINFNCTVQHMSPPLTNYLILGPWRNFSFSLLYIFSRHSFTCIGEKKVFFCSKFAYDSRYESTTQVQHGKIQGGTI